MADVENAPPPNIPFRVTDPSRIPAARYHDEEFYRLETERLWPHIWQMACRLEMIPNVGDYTEYTNLGKSVIIVRTKDGVKAFHNVCRHRGVQLAEGSGNCKTQGFICPFHGWRWNMDGENTFVYGRHLFDERQLDAAEIALKPCRVEEALGCAFINWDDDAPSLRECIGPLLDRLDEYRIDKLRAEWWYATVLPANWKTAMEAFMEGYHVLRTHPQLHGVLGTLYNSMYGEPAPFPNPANPDLGVRENIQAQYEHLKLLNEGMAGMCHAKDVETARQLLDMELPDDPMQAVMAWYGRLKEEVVKQGRARGEPTPDIVELAKTHPIKSVEFIFPHYFLLPYLSSMSTYRIRPLGPESCMFELWSLTYFPEGEEPAPVMEPVVLPYDSQQFPPIPRQDYENIPRQQLGLHAGGFDYMRLSHRVEGLVSTYQRVIDGYLMHLPPAKLAQATHAIGGGFDGPIVDIGI